MIESITYYADNGSLGDTDNKYCDLFRNWVFEQLSREFPNHNVAVSSDMHYLTVETSDEENREKIEYFCSTLYDACPWDFD